MAGSITWRRYTDDRGNNYSYLVDKSNADAVWYPDNILLSSPRFADNPLLPCGLRKRYLLAYAANTITIKRKFWVGNSNVFASPSLLLGGVYITTGLGSPAETIWIVSSIHGESLSIPKFAGERDTGLVDGTVSQ